MEDIKSARNHEIYVIQLTIMKATIRVADPDPDNFVKIRMSWNWPS
jgi:hypothetical protein